MPNTANLGVEVSSVKNCSISFNIGNTAIALSGNFITGDSSGQMQPAGAINSTSAIIRFRPVIQNNQILWRCVWVKDRYDEGMTENNVPAPCQEVTKAAWDSASGDPLNP